MHDHYLAACAIIRNEAPYLAEWITFHNLIGAEHFFLYNNNSDDEYESVLEPFIKSGLVTLFDWPTPFHQKAQRKAYTHCLELARGCCRWLACIDIDEFLFSPACKTITEMLVDYEEYPGVVVHWQTYGSSGQKMISNDPVIKRFTWRAPTNWIRNRMIKSIVDPSRTVAPLGVHHFLYLHDVLPVDETGMAISMTRKPAYRKLLKKLYGKLGPLQQYTDPYSSWSISNSTVPVRKLRINHYPVKSYEEFLKKAAYKKEKRRYEDVNYFSYHDRNDIHDPVLIRYLPNLQDRLPRT